MTDGHDPSIAGDGSSMTYEELVDALEQLTHRMADGDVGIEEAVDLYERAGRLHAQAAERLDRIQERIARLAPAPPQDGQ
ncbi:MAG TPA: exodeoxyribonuclease VII small subunit [Acidimicrobiales bacterium]|nr:exodeoxyribonuclease VII small subunit [Acidimicrobiales bacterium]